MKIRIHNTRKCTSYVVHSVSECKDATDKSMYQTCLIMGNTVSMGEMVAEIVKEPED